MRSSVGILADSFNWKPTYLPNMITWLDGSDASTITQSGGEISQWRDKAIGLHYNQDVAAQKPLWGYSTINGKTAVYFATTNQHLYGPSMTMPQPFTVAVVATSTTTASQARIWGTGIQNQNPSVGRSGNMAYGGSLQSIAIAGAFSTLNVPHSIICVFNGSSADNGVGSILSADSANPGAGGNCGTVYLNSERPTVGGPPTGNFWSGAIAEVIVVNSFMDQTNRSKLNSYFKRKWKIA